MLAFTEHHAHQPVSIVWLHGAGITGWMWDAQVARITEHHSIVVDLPGHGASHGIHWVSLDETADLVAEVIRTHAHGGSAVVVGLSLGGDIGLRLLARHPELVRASVLTGMVAKPVGGAILWMQRAFAPLASRPFFHRASAASMKLGPERTAEYLATVLPLRTDDYRAIVTEIFTGVSLEGLETVTVPTLAMAGAKEPKVARESTAIIAERMPGATARVESGVGHVWNIEAPDRFNQTVRDWIALHAR